MSATPTRTCVSCGDRAPQSELLRLQLDETGRLGVVEQPKAGRSGYLHRSEKCVKALVKARGIKRSLSRGVDRDERARVVEAISRSPGFGATTESSVREG